MISNDVREYFEIPVYRNVLDMLTQFESYLNDYGIMLANNLSVYNAYILPNSKAIVGYSIKNGYKIGRKGRYSGWVFLFESLNDAGLLKNKRYTINKQSNLHRKNKSLRTPIIKYVKLTNNPINNILQFGRTLTYELNRVRLPLPHNFLQIINIINGKNYKITSTYSRIESDTGGTETSYTHDSNAFINVIEGAKVYSDLKESVNLLRVGVRKEIDAANFSEKVAEETIRLEREALITRQEAAEEAELRRQQILIDKAKEYDESILRLNEQRVELAAELESARLDIAEATSLLTVATEEEAVEINNNIVDAENKVNDINNVIADVNINLDTTENALKNAGESFKEIVTIIDNMRDKTINMLETINDNKPTFIRSKTIARPQQINNQLPIQNKKSLLTPALIGGAMLTLMSLL